MTASSSPTCTAFLGARRVAFGAYDEVARALAALDLSAGGLLVFDDATGAQVDHPWPAGYPAAPANAADAASAIPCQANSVISPTMRRCDNMAKEISNSRAARATKGARAAGPR